jgi:hypothetical protein
LRAPALLLLSGFFLLLLAGSASAASLSVSAPQNAYVDDVLTITTTGSTEQSSDVVIYYEPNGPDCAGTLGDERARVNTSSIDGRSADAGSFTFLSQFQPREAAVYRLCGYLYYWGDNTDTAAPRAAATTTITVSRPPDRDACPDVPASGPMSASTSDGCPRPIAPRLSGRRSQRASSWVTVRAACNRPCQLSAVGVIGGRKLRGAGPVGGGTTATTLRLGISASQLKSIRKHLKKGKTVKASITVNALYPSGKRRASSRDVVLTK